jgi:hypothetical protein
MLKKIVSEYIGVEREGFGFRSVTDRRNGVEEFGRKRKISRYKVECTDKCLFHRFSL